MLQVFHHWWMPVLSAIIWWGMLIALLSCWAAQGHPVYSWMHDPGQKILYISNISATNLQPIFISCSAAQGLLFVGSLASERWLRHRSRLRPHFRAMGKWFSASAIFFAVIGELGILFVSIFNTRYFHDAHVSMLVVFIAFIGVSSLCSIVEYAYLDRDYRRKRHMVVSLYGKITWFICELGVCIAFPTSQKHHPNASAVLEWVISFLYPFYTLLLAWDLWPAYNKAAGHYPRYQDYSKYPTSGEDYGRDPEAVMASTQSEPAYNEKF